MINNSIYELPFNKIQKLYFNKNREKMERYLNFIEKIPYQLFKNDPTLEWLRTKYFKKFASILHLKLKISANIMSLIGLFFAFLALIYSHNLILFTIFIFLNLISDGLDGVIARISGTNNRIGELFDVTCDTISSILFIIAMTYNNYISNVIGVIFVLILIPYTFIVAKKSIVLINKAQSIGSRISVGFGTMILTSLASLNVFSISQYSISLKVFFVIISISLGFALLQSLLKFIVNNI